MNLSKEARAALLAAQGRMGAPVRQVASVIVELYAQGLVTRAGNLTFRGLSARRAALDEMLRTLEDGNE